MLLKDPSNLRIFGSRWMVFFDFVKSVKIDSNANSSSSFVLAKKLNFLKSKLKVWNREVVSHLERSRCSMLRSNFNPLPRLKKIRGQERTLVRSEVVAYLLETIQPFGDNRPCSTRFLKVIEILNFFTNWLTSGENLTPSEAFVWMACVLITLLQ